MDIRGFGMARRKRRSWSDEEKRSICLQTTAPGVSVAQVARRYVMLALASLNRACQDQPDFSATLTTMAFDYSS